MKKKGEQTKRNIAEAAISLFQYQGFHGTSIRQIAQRAEVNIALISYYFKNKQGILEYLFIQFYEGLLQESKHLFPERVEEDEPIMPHLLRFLRMMMQYYYQHQELAVLVHRELSVDSTLMREVMTLYLAKAKYYLFTLLEWGRERKEFVIPSVEVAAIQIQSLIITPFLNPQVLQEVYYLPVQSSRFYEEYMEATERAVIALIQVS